MCIWINYYKRCNIFPKPSALKEGRLLPCSYDFERNEIIYIEFFNKLFYISSSVFKCLTHNYSLTRVCHYNIIHSKSIIHLFVLIRKWYDIGEIKVNTYRSSNTYAVVLYVVILPTVVGQYVSASSLDHTTTTTLAKHIWHIICTFPYTIAILTFLI